MFASTFGYSFLFTGAIGVAMEYMLIIGKCMLIRKNYLFVFFIYLLKSYVFASTFDFVSILFVDWSNNNCKGVHVFMGKCM